MPGERYMRNCRSDHESNAKLLLKHGMWQLTAYHHMLPKLDGVTVHLKKNGESKCFFHDGEISSVEGLSLSDGIITVYTGGVEGDCFLVWQYTMDGERLGDYVMHLGADVSLTMIAKASLVPGFCWLMCYDKKQKQTIIMRYQFNSHRSKVCQQSPGDFDAMALSSDGKACVLFKRGSGVLRWMSLLNGAYIDGQVSCGPEEYIDVLNLTRRGPRPRALPMWWCLRKHSEEKMLREWRVKVQSDRIRWDPDDSVDGASMRLSV